MFSLRKTSNVGRRGTLLTPHGAIETPFFLPVATAGAMKGITLPDLESLGASALLCNTYHLHLAPGEDVIAQAGGLHSFIGWEKPILTDSGGFQVFSLKNLRTITDEGVEFRDHRNGDLKFLGPKEAMEIQWKLKSDIMMCFDECPPSTAPAKEQQSAVARTLTWAKVCKKFHDERTRELAEKGRPLLFGIVQGGLDAELRKRCAEELIAMDFDGYAIGGLAVGESEEEMLSIVEAITPLLPSEKPRYLMGVGDLGQIRKAVALGIDMFDCVAAMREARHGNVWLGDGTKLRIRRAEYANDHTPIDPESPSPLSRRHSRAYLRHLFMLGERYGETIACMQNMAVTLKLMESLRN